MAISQIQSASLASGVPASSNMPTGSLLQVVTGTITSNVSTTSNGTWVTTGLAATITPKFATSKVYVLVSGTAYATVANAQFCATIFRGATNLCAAGLTNNYINGGTSMQSNVPCSIQIMDTPATTSATTYTLYFQNSNGTSSVQFNAGGVSNNQIATIALMEIAA